MAVEERRKKKDVMPVNVIIYLNINLTSSKS